MIPKVIHYCWFGEAPLPDSAKKCISSWEKYCPEFKIIEWNESNCDLQCNRFVSQASSAKKWAFVSDYFRYKIIEEQGGVYLDTDVEIIASIEDILQNEAYMGFEFGKKSQIASGLGFGAIPHHPIISALRQEYEKIPFIRENGSYDTTPCPARDTVTLVKMGLQANNTMQIIGGAKFYPAEYFCPTSLWGDSYFTQNTRSIHHYHASWKSEKENRKMLRKKALIKKFGKHFGKAMSSIINAIEKLKK